MHMVSAGPARADQGIAWLPPKWPAASNVRYVLYGDQGLQVDIGDRAPMRPGGPARADALPLLG
jgi:hypothetical protein